MWFNRGKGVSLFVRTRALVLFLVVNVATTVTTPFSGNGVVTVVVNVATLVLARFPVKMICSAALAPTTATGSINTSPASASSKRG